MNLPRGARPNPARFRINGWYERSMAAIKGFSDPLRTVAQHALLKTKNPKADPRVRLSPATIEQVGEILDATPPTERLAFFEACLPGLGRYVEAHASASFRHFVRGEWVR